MSISLTAQPCLMKTLTRSSALNDTGFSWHLKKMAFLFLTLLEWIRCSKNSLHSQLFLLTLRPRLTMKRKPRKTWVDYIGWSWVPYEEFCRYRRPKELLIIIYIIIFNIVKGLNPRVISKGWVSSSGWT